MESSDMDNDTRGWIMCVVSGIACVVGASIICVDLIIRLLPSRKNFRIQDSGVFLAASLSLSFGVMIFSSLYGMLPSAKNYLIKGGFSKSAASWILISSFVGGIVGIQIVSRFLHHYIPSHVVDCDHTHAETHTHTEDNSLRASRSHSQHAQSAHTHSHIRQEAQDQFEGLAKDMEATPLLNGGKPNALCGRPRSKSGRKASFRGDRPASHLVDSRRPSMVQVQHKVLSFVKDKKNDCDETGPCFGYSDPCGQQCFKHLGLKTPNVSRASTMARSVSGKVPVSTLFEENDNASGSASAADGRFTARPSRSVSRHSQEYDHACESELEGNEDLEAQHHHHVPENAFMSIGLQTSIAIALHKLPEGFITYATNHANPQLGFSVFMALFIHNITEGFAMALPLYLALGSRMRAMFWSSLLGGISQPLGAGIAALWFKLAGHTNHAPGYSVYGVMFAITAGIMASVALSLFVESLSLNHNRTLCIGFSIIGMTILGISNALTAA